MSTIYLSCQNAQGLKLGPNDEIKFVKGFARVDTEQYPEWEQWARSQHNWRIENLGANEDGQAADGLPCEICGKSFKAKVGLDSHKRAHARQAIG